MSTWETRELPLLRAIDTLLGRGRGRGRGSRASKGVTIAQLAEQAGFTEEEVRVSLRVLAESHGPYITGRFLLQPEPETAVTGLTDRARVELDKVDGDVRPKGPGQAPPRRRTKA